MSWHLRVQYYWGGRRLRWLQFGPMSYSKAAAEGERQAREGRNARLVDPDGKEGPLIGVPRSRRPENGEPLQLDLFSRG